mmetsp:Transcript_99496/g.197158  ORF Transcript_99496/g.197158 Transcript_99496/m.197158 type:complete len:314 (+) Transcript_99496:82-1023(+)
MGCFADAGAHVAADDDPAHWPGVQEVPVPATWLPESREPRVTDNPDGEVRCERCYQKIDGVRCYEDGKCLHFGCASEDVREAVANGQRLSASESIKHQLREDCSQTMLDCFGEAEVSSMLVRFHNGCELNKARYGFDLEVARVFVIRNEEIDMRFERGMKTLRTKAPNVKELYHGTSRAHAKAIISHGFRLPSRAGMFGKGIYFAGTPLKSWQYSMKGESQSSSSKHYMLVCDVALGLEAEMRQAGVPKRSGWWRLFRTCKSPFTLEADSVVGLSQDQGGALRVPEYVVYRSCQAVPRFMLELRERKRNNRPT